ncbi:MAG TPA: glutamate 5-kinase [Chitinophagaceae bacterium]|nr:glutamate 5-kinase [Chitinophagaceae bacterium]
MQKPVLVIKLGTAVISDEKGVSQHVIKKVASEVATLASKYKVVLVSSGAVGSGKKLLKQYKGTLTERKAAAAVGNPILIMLYQKYFEAYGIPVAQALCERHHFSDRAQFLQLKDTFGTFWQNGIVPVVNENDLVSNVELKFSDNDELAALIAIGFNAAAMIICTSVGGFMNDEKKIIPFVGKIDSKISAFVKSDKTNAGLGGMVSKLTFTRLASSLGIKVIICGLSAEAPFREALQGTNGTTFKAQSSNLRARQKWLASGSITLGSIMMDKGAVKALHQRRSLLTVGVKNVQGKFAAGEVVQLIDEDEQIIGVAKVKLAARAIEDNISVRNMLAAHADDIVLF